MNDKRNNAIKSDLAAGSERDNGDGRLSTPDTTIFYDALKRSLWQQLPTFLLCALLLDGGKVFRVCLIAMLGFWLIALIVLARRVPGCDRMEWTFFRWGFLPLFAVLLFLNNTFHPQFRH